MKKGKKITKQERLKRMRETNKLIAFSQLPYDLQLNSSEMLAEI